MDYVVPSSDTTANLGDISNIVTRSNVYQTKHNKEAYVQIEFKERYVFATHYSLKGYQSGSYFVYAKEWYLYGFDSEGGTPTLITTNTSEGSHSADLVYVVAAAIGEHLQFQIQIDHTDSFE